MTLIKSADAADNITLPKDDVLMVHAPGGSTVSVTDTNSSSSLGIVSNGTTYFGPFNTNKRISIKCLSGRGSYEYTDDKRQGAEFTEIGTSVSIPRFSSVAQVNNTANLTVHSSGDGIVRSGSGTGTGYISIPQCDAADQWVVAIQIEVNDSSALTVGVSNEAQSGYSGAQLIAASGGVSAFVNGFNSQFLNSGGAPAVAAGTRLWFVVSCNGTNVLATVLRDGINWQKYTESAAFQEPLTSICARSTAATLVANGGAAWGSGSVVDRLTRVFISTASDTNKVLKVYARVGSMLPARGAPAFPLIIEPNLSLAPISIAENVRGAWVGVPASYWTAEPDIVMLHHANANPGTLLQNSGQQPTQFALLNSGYVVASGSGSNSYTDWDTNGGTASSWGAAVGLKYRKALLDWIRLNLPRCRNMHALGLSMGAQVAFSFEAMYPGSTRSIATISGATDLVTNYAGFTARIQASYGDAYVSLGNGNTGNAPASSPANWGRISAGRGAPADTYYSSPYTWRASYAGGTTYALNDIVLVPTSLTAAHFGSLSALNMGPRLVNVPVTAWHGTSDATIAASQSSSLVDAINVTGGQATYVPITTSSHLGTAMFLTSDIVSFFNGQR